MSEALVRLLLLSLAGSLLALLLYLLQPLLKRIVTRRILYVLWIVVLVRMVVPVGIASIGTGAFLSPATPTPAITQPAVTRTPTPPAGTATPVPTTPPVTTTPVPTSPATTATASPTKPAAAPTIAADGTPGGSGTTGGGTLASLFTSASDAVDGVVRSLLASVTPLSAALLGAWLLGALLILSCGRVRHSRVLRAIRSESHSASVEDVALLDACRAEFRIRQPVEMIRAASAPTPFLSGIRKPLLCLPDRDYSKEELRLVLFHELTHLKHRDLWVKLVSHWICAVHWFNPAVHLIRHELSAAAELACDESVSARLEKSDRKRYGEVLLQQAAMRPHHIHPGTQALSESGRRLRQRLKVISQMQGAPRRRKFAGLVAMLLLLVVPFPSFAPIALTGCAAPTATPTPRTRHFTEKDIVAAWKAASSDFVRQADARIDLAMNNVVPIAYSWGTKGAGSVFIYIYESEEQLQKALSLMKQSTVVWLANTSLTMSETVENLMIVAAASGTDENANDFFHLVQDCVKNLYAGLTPSVSMSPAPTPSESRVPPSPYPTIPMFDTMPSDDIVAAAVDIRLVTIMGRTLYLPAANLPTGNQPYTENEILHLPRYILYWTSMMVKDEGISVRCDTQTGAIKAILGGGYLSDDGTQIAYIYEDKSATPTPGAWNANVVRIRNLDTGEVMDVARGLSPWSLGPLHDGAVVFINAKNQLCRYDLNSKSTRVLLEGAFDAGVAGIKAILGTSVITGTMAMYDKSGTLKDLGFYIYDMKNDILETARVNTALEPHLYYSYDILLSPDWTRVLFEITRGSSNPVNWTFSCAVAGIDLQHPVSYSLDLLPGPAGTNAIWASWKDAGTLALSYDAVGESESTHLGDTTQSLDASAPSSDNPFYYRIYSGGAYTATWTDVLVTPMPRFGP